MAARTFWIPGLALAAVASALLARSSGLGLDYYAPPCDPEICDDGALPINALVSGNLDRFFAEQQPMGAFSILLRAPFVLLADVFDGSQLGRYRFGSFVCLLALALLALFLARTLQQRGRPWTVWTVVPAFVLVNPLTYQALKFGHPEELLAAALTVAAVLAAARRRGVLAGVLLGAAVATKQWAALAAIPVLLAAPPAARLRLGAAGLAVALVFTLPMFLGDPGRFLDAQRTVGSSASMEYKVTAANVWWPLASASSSHLPTESGKVELVTQYSLPDWLGGLTHPLVLALGVGLALLYARRRRGADPEDVLGLLALIFLLRCLLDPITFSYHHVPFLVCLVSWEALRRRVPVASGVAIVATLLLTEVVAPLRDAAAVNVFYLSWTLPMAAYLALACFAPGWLPRRAEQVRAGLRRRPALERSLP